MILDIVGAVLQVTVPFREVTPKQMLDQRLQILIEAFWVPWFCVYDFSVDVHWVVVLEGRVACQHFVEQDTKCPPINSQTVTLIKQYFRRNVLWSSANGIRTFLDDLRESEINHFQITVRADHNVFRLQVPIHNLLALQVLKNGDDLASIKLCLLGIEVTDSSVVREEVTAL